MIKKIDRWLYKHWARWEMCRRAILSPGEVMMLDVVLAVVSWFIFLHWRADVAYVVLFCAHGMTLVMIVTVKDPDS